MIPQVLESTWWSCSKRHLCYQIIESQITHHGFRQQEGDPLMQKELEGAYLSISLRISSSAMLLSCE